MRAVGRNWASHPDETVHGRTHTMNFDVKQAVESDRIEAELIKDEIVSQVEMMKSINGKGFVAANELDMQVSR